MCTVFTTFLAFGKIGRLVIERTQNISCSNYFTLAWVTDAEQPFDSSLYVFTWLQATTYMLRLPTPGSLVTERAYSRRA